MRVKKLPGAREQQLDVVVQLRHRAHGGARRAHRIGLVNRNRGRHALHAVHRRFVHAVEKLPRVGAEGFHIAPLPFGIQRVKHQAGFAQAAFKQDGDPLGARERVISDYAAGGFGSIDPTDLHGRFRWWGLYTQRKQGIDGGRTAQLDVTH